MLKRICKLATGILVLSLFLHSCNTLKGTGNPGLVAVDSPDMFTSRLKLTIPQEKNKKQTLNGSVKMVRDELIQISLVAPVLRTEAARVEVTPYELLVIDRINKQYAQTGAGEIRMLLGDRMDYERLQTLLSDAVFLQSSTGWAMRDGNVRVDIPVQDVNGRHELVMELNRISIPDQKPVPANPSSRYVKKELSELIESIQGLE